MVISRFFIFTDLLFDLFGWGTSGYDEKYPYLTSINYKDYYYGGDIAGTNYDWGTNAISNGGSTANSGWRTLTRDEWEYLLFERETTSYVRFAKATINGVAGLIIFPDDWSTSYYAINNYDEYYNKYYSDNVISSSDWTSTLEAHGAVFLPVFGFRADTNLLLGMNGTVSRYWTSTYFGFDEYGSESECANCLMLLEDYDEWEGEIYPMFDLSPYVTAPTFLGAFVRLVKDAN